MPPLEPQNNNEVELEAILLETQNQSDTLDDIRATNEVQALESSKTNEELRELNSAVDILIEKVSEPIKKEIENSIAIEINGGEFSTIIGPKGDDGEKGDKGDKPTPMELVELIKPMIPAPINGKDGIDGVDGYTPIKGVDYFDGIDGKTPTRKELKDLIKPLIPEPKKGKDGVDGKDGINADEISPNKLKDKLLEAGLSFKDIKDTPDYDGIAERVNKLSSKTVSLKELDDVDLSGATVTNGKYVIPYALVSGTNIKTINNTSILNSGNLYLANDTLEKTFEALGGGANDLSVITVAGTRAGGIGIDLVDGQLRLTAMYVPTDMTITGLKVVMTRQGSYTADNNNKIGLYSYNAGTLTLVASSADDENIWKAPIDTVITKSFTTPYNAIAGVYFIAVLYNSSAQVTAPRLATGTFTVGLGVSMLTNGAFFAGNLSGQTDLPTSVSASSFTPLLNTLLGIAY